MKHIEDLLDIMRQLRDPDNGCPWDKQQTFSSLSAYTLEEAYEVAHSIDSGNMEELRDELGDLLFQVVFYARIAEESGHFSFNDIVNAICEKMVRRHPHVFADEQFSSIEQQTESWEALKRQEREAKNKGLTQTSILDGVIQALPAMMRAYKLGKKAALVNFDWTRIEDVVGKVEEEIMELREALQKKNNQHIEQETGDLLFSCVNLARHANIDPEMALRYANNRFESRFRSMEKICHDQGHTLDSLTADELDILWERAKQLETSS
jgi:ATP diphosphatase